MANGGVGGSFSAASDAQISNAATDDILVRNSSGRWQNTPIVGKAAMATNGGLETVATISATGNVALDLATGNVFNVTLTGNTTFTAFNGSTNGKACSFSLYLKQDATGGRTVAWPTGVRWSGGAPTLSTAANAIDILVFESLNGGTVWFGSLVGTNFV